MFWRRKNSAHYEGKFKAINLHAERHSQFTEFFFYKFQFSTQNVHNIYMNKWN